MMDKNFPYRAKLEFVLTVLDYVADIRRRITAVCAD